jgi:hypothetical protein
MKGSLRAGADYFSSFTSNSLELERVVQSEFARKIVPNVSSIITAGGALTKLIEFGFHRCSPA